ncbi:UDP-GalNAc:beta-1,3-N-acetylgalactosaminyltransferase 1 [Nematostella vectensis]|uniref:UDP-GalNAc:beta-1, 3-N-acetylgalactosaminyltransferase 1 n=1 Tax=Nematostella vectensis TaxID=45351 RepID=UPI0020779BFD|nr:UDP-GalNAc:beta-1,3-N-acetylgalactosaminyltransferase 1 [Nematostella vectensis]
MLIKHCRRRTKVGCLLLTACNVVFIWLLNFSSIFNVENINESLIVEDANFTILEPAFAPSSVLEAVDVLVIISTSPSSFEKRTAIRKTWGKFDTPQYQLLSDERRRIPTWRTIFMTGIAADEEVDTKLQEESKLYDDLLIFAYKDSYRKITNKLIGSLQWASRGKFEFLLKTDDDVYVSVPRLYQWLVNTGCHLKPVYAGKLYSGTVERDEKHRHYVSTESLKLKFYPVFCKGSMFVLSATLVPKLVELSRKVQRIPPDDAYVGLLAHEMKVKPTAIQSLVQLSLMPYIFPFLDSCHYQTVIGVGDSLTPAQLAYVHLQITNKQSPWPCVHRWTKILVVLIVLVALYLLIMNLKGFAIKTRRHHRKS